MSMKKETHPLAGKTVEIIDGKFKGEKYRIEDWQINVYGGQSWMFADGNPAALEYAMRSAMERTPTDNNVLYGKIGHLGKMIHVSQIGEVSP